MKLLPLAAALAVFTAAPVFAASTFTVNFEKAWDYGTTVDNYYAGGTASDGTAGANLGVSFTNVLGLSNSADFTFYQNAPSMQGVAMAQTFAGDAAFATAYMNVAAGVSNALWFAYSSPTALSGAIKAYSGLNGTGSLLGTFNMAGTGGSTIDGLYQYDKWTQTAFAFSGTAMSFDFTGSANVAGLDNIAAVPEPETFAMLLSGLGVVAFIARRRKRQAA